ncbi:MAG: hypothetical protein GX151_00525 [Gammaproteobacteria bacterium]|jgi:hypothetical protein|uniref:hypothetical protein n=1 Tax=Acinetobacter TaxID=469 RepID=UPI0014441694|nr:MULTISPECIES: hypothetical protein [Acinetobacter]MBF4521503.1 hypothetical protein [Acinetobacter towneri]MDM1486433.1 hypothetical protein [Acinetobacter towneri]MEB6564268.1 hypothetical protein [Acinetobacter towneri]NLN56468.1 hypothetical protein [Gammaproteobacteria bacterium]
MYLKEQLIRVENIKTIHALAQADIDPKVIALFMCSEGIDMQAHEVTAITNTYDALGTRKIPSKKVKALIAAKALGEQDESLPCPV